MAMVAAVLLLIAFPPTDVERAQMISKTAELRRRVEAVRGKAASELVADVEVHAKAGEFLLRYPEEFFQKQTVSQLLAVLDRGLARASELEQGRAAWAKRTGRIARAYVSKIDGSVQPYGVAVPASYTGQPMRLDVVLHGRNANLTEAGFLFTHESERPADEGKIELDVYGRGNNAYRWAGETDVFEAIESVKSRYSIDPRRIVLRGFSMGGAGAWHLGLHHPDRWAAFEAGAGFTETVRYAKRDAAPEWERRAMHIYDAVDYASNGVNTPFVGYGGEIDAQLQASKNIQEALAGVADLRALFLVGPKTGHKWEPESLKRSNRFLDEALPRRDPARVRFVTWTTRYPAAWKISVEGMERHYERAEVTLDGERVTTTNVARLRLPGRYVIDGQAVDGEEFEKVGGRWGQVKRDRGLRKRPGLQGPIDDAFREAFVCVPPETGTHPEFERLKREFPKWLRGDVRVATAATADAGRSHLALFGDPSTNPLIRKIAKKLPVEWKGATFRLGGRTWNSATHDPALIYPNPLNPARYVVINSGHSFGEAEFKGTNALLYPRRGDWAVIEKASGGVAAAGFFDEKWQ